PAAVGDLYLPACDARILIDDAMPGRAEMRFLRDADRAVAIVEGEDGLFAGKGDPRGARKRLPQHLRRRGLMGSRGRSWARSEMPVVSWRLAYRACKTRSQERDGQQANGSCLRGRVAISGYPGSHLVASPGACPPRRYTAYGPNRQGAG